MTGFYRPAVAACAAPFLLFFGIAAATGQEFRLLSGGQFVEISGEIEGGAAERFADVLENNPQLVGVRLDSLGGDPWEAHEISKSVSLLSLSTHIAQDGVCASSCALIFFAGHDRFGQGALGLHRVEFSTFYPDIREVGPAMQVATAAGIPWQVREIMLTTPSDDMHWIVGDEFVKLGLNRDLPGDARTYMTTSARVAQGAPRFSDFPAVAYLTGQPNTPEGAFLMYAPEPIELSLLEEEVGNFAGKYALTFGRCGAGCPIPYVVDLEHGRMIDVGYGGEGDTSLSRQLDLSAEFRRDSRLLRLTWPYLGQCMQHDLVIEGGALHLIGQRRFPSDGGCWTE